MNSRRKVILAAVSVCIVGLMSGCSHSLIQEDGIDRHVAKLAINKEDGFLISLFGGSTNTRVVTNEAEETLQLSPTIREAELYRKMIAQGQSELALASMHEDSKLTADVQIKKELVKDGLGKEVLDILNK